MRRVFIVNPAARSCPRSLGETILKRFPDAKIRLTRHPGHARDIVLEEKGKADLIVACGGDGTFREAAQAVDDQTLLGILPVGTVNQISAQLNIPGSLAGALDVLERGCAVKLYAGGCWFDGDSVARLFFIGVSAGPDADAVHLVSPRLKRLIGANAYGAGFLKRVLKPVRPEITCKPDLGKSFSASQVIAVKSRLYGGRFKFAKEQSLTTPGLEMVWTDGGLWSVCGMFVRSLRGNYDKGLALAPGRELVLELPGPGRFQMDGDAVIARKAVISAPDKYLRVLAG